MVGEAFTGVPVNGPGTLVVVEEFWFNVNPPELVLAPRVTLPVVLADMVTVKVAGTVPETATVWLVGLKVAPPAGLMVGVTRTLPLKPDAPTTFTV